MMRSIWIASVVLLAACGRAALPNPVYPLSTTPDAAFREQAPAPAKHTRAWSTLGLTTRTLANGLRVTVVQRPGARLVSFVYVCSRAGKNPESYPADIAALTGDVMLRGFRFASGEEVSGARVGGSVPFASTWENGTGIGITVLREAARPALNVLASIVQRPLIADDGVSAAKESQANYLFDVSRTVGGVVGPLKASLLYGEHHRFALDNFRWARELPEITAAEVRRYYQATYQPNTSTLIVVGDVVPEEILAAVEAELGPWRGSGATPPAQARARSLEPEQREHRIFAVLNGGSTTTLTVLHPIPDPTKVNPHTFGVLHQLIAGGYSSQLWTTLRHQAGLTYGVYGGVSLFPEGGYLEIETDVPNDETTDTLDEILDAIDAVRTTPPSAEALSVAKASYLARLQPESVEAMAWQLARFEAAGLAPESLKRAFDTVSDLSPREIASAAQLLSSETTVVLMTGNFYRYLLFASRGDVRLFEIKSVNE